MPGAFKGRLPKGCFRISDIVSWLSRLFIFSRRFSSSFVVASLARTPCICIVLTKLGGMAGRGEGGSLQLKKDPPKNWGKEPSPRGTLSGTKSDRPLSRVIVVECYCYYIDIIVEPPDLVPSRRRPFSLHKINISDLCMAQMALTLQQNE